MLLTPDPALRSKLLDFYIDCSTSADLADWLRDIGQETRGTLAERQSRVRAGTKYLTMPAETFPKQTLSYLSMLGSDALADLCDGLGLSPDGTKDERYRRIMREVRYREGWYPRPERGATSACTLPAVREHLEGYPITARAKYERDLYPAFASEMTEVFGNENVYEQYAIAYGTTLKIDFHIGHPQRQGVGVEFKMPANNSDLQRALGQLDQYKAHYGDNLVLALFPDFITSAQEALFTETAREKAIALVIK